MAAVNDDPWHYDMINDRYVHVVTREELTPAQWQARQQVGRTEEAPWSGNKNLADSRAPPPIPPRASISIAMVPLPEVLDVLTEVGRTYYRDDDNVKRFAAHVADKVRALVNVRDPKELLR